MSNQNTGHLDSFRNYDASKHGIVLTADVEFTHYKNGFLSLTLRLLMSYIYIWSTYS